MSVSENGMVITDRKRFWVPLFLYKERPSFLPSWLSHLFFVLITGTLIASILLISGIKHEFHALTMIRTHKFYDPKDASKEEPNSKKINNSALQIFNSSQILKHISSKLVHPISKPKAEASENSIKEEMTAKINDDQFLSYQVPVVAIESSIIEKIRSDPKRIYLDKSFIVGDITFEFRNASEHGIEVYAYNQNRSGKTYYFPKVVIGGAESSFDGGVLVPGSGRYGWVVVPNLRGKHKILAQLSVAGGDKIKQHINLDW